MNELLQQAAKARAYSNLFGDNESVDDILYTRMGDIISPPTNAAFASTTACSSRNDVYRISTFGADPGTTAKSGLVIYAIIGHGEDAILSGDGNLWKQLSSLKDRPSAQHHLRDYLRCVPNIGAIEEIAILQTDLGLSTHVQQHSSMVSSPRELLLELRRLSGCTWDEIATLLTVSRRAVHAWLRGGTIRTIHLSKLGKIVDLLRFTDRGSTEDNRALLFGLVLDGTSVFDLIKKGDYAIARQLAGKGRGRAKRLAGTVDQNRTPMFGPRDLASTLDQLPSEDDPEPEVVARGRPRRLKLRRT